MTGSAVVRTLAESTAAALGDGSRWADWLTVQIDPLWRPGEWDAARWFFDGDPANLLTAAGVCEVSSCRVKTDGPRMCSPCQKAFRVSSMPRVVFVAEHDASRQKIPNGSLEKCRVIRDGVECVAAVHCLGLCQSHYASFAYSRRSRDRSLEEWLQRARPYLDTRASCLVEGCEELVAGRQQLCSYHHHRRRRQLADGAVGAGGSAAVWAETAAPFLRAGQFSLAPVRPLVRLELIYALQQRAARRGVVQPKTMRLVVNHVADRDRLVGVSAEQLAGPSWQTCPELAIMMREIERWLTEGHEAMCGVDPRQRLVWDLRQLNLHANKDSTQVRRAKGSLDFSVIGQDWLRRLSMRYCATFTSTVGLHKVVLVSQKASGALEHTLDGGHDPAALGPLHLDAITAGFRSWCLPDGSPRSQGYRHDALHIFFLMLDFGRRAGLLDTVPSVFARDPKRHRIKKVKIDDEAGRAIPEPVIAQLDRHLHLLSCPVIYRGWTQDQMDQMFRTLYLVMRDTGRRPREVCSLRVDCLDHTSDGALLIWDNHKSGRRSRRLPITGGTAEIIEAWRTVRLGLTSGDVRDHYLFPARTLGVPDAYFMPANLSDGLRVWVHDTIPELHSDSVDTAGVRQPVDRTRIYPYAFRHSYAQRHADAGVPIDVLRDLMDHKDVATTQGYYRVTLKRKREAVRTLHRQVVDRTGAPAPAPSQTAYELRTVAAPFGSCTEPANVKAGGSACPIRFQCAGCGFYRADPSYLPAIEDHIQALAADRERATAMGVDDFVIRNFNDQISAYQHVLEGMRTRLAGFGDEERHEVEQAAAILRKVRAGLGRPQLPIIAVSAGPR